VIVAVDAQIRPLHRYSFDGVGTTVLDSVGTADGTVVGAALTGQGSLALAGGTGDQAQYVVLPPRRFAELRDATLEAWVNWAGSVASTGAQLHWQRIFDFGEGSTGVEGEQAPGGSPARSYLFLTPQTDPRTASEVPDGRVAFQVPHDPQSVTLETVVNTTPLPSGVDTHVGVVVDAVNHRMSLFVNGAIVGAVDLVQDDPLSYVYDVNDWLGRSQFAQDDGFVGTFIEFRIYAAALTPSQMQASYDAGPHVVW
jgi:hypothetical protein